MSPATMRVPGLSVLQVDPSPAEQKQILTRGHSFVRSIDLSSPGTVSPGLLVDARGYGLYMMHRSPPNTMLEVRFDEDFSNMVEFRRGTFHKPGPVGKARTPAHFDRFYVVVNQSGDTSGTAYFLVLGAPEAQYWEDAVSVPYAPAANTNNVGSTVVTVLSAINVETLHRARLWVQNNGGNALASAPVEISPDGTVWEEILLGTFQSLPASTPLSAALPDGIRSLRMRAATASGVSTSITTYLTGAMG